MINILVLNKWRPEKDNPNFAMVAIRDKYIKEAEEKNEDIQIKCEWETMTIPVEEARKRIRFSRPVADKATGLLQLLAYFIWNKDPAPRSKEAIKQAAKIRKKAKKQKILDEAAALYAKDPDAWRRKYTV